jgi:hypothetical protein
MSMDANYSLNVHDFGDVHYCSDDNDIYDSVVLVYVMFVMFMMLWMAVMPEMVIVSFMVMSWNDYVCDVLEDEWFL